MTTKRMTKQDYFNQGALEFLCGRHIAVYGYQNHWTRRARTAGDKAIRVFLFESTQPGYDVIKNFHNSVLKSKHPFSVAELHLTQFKQSEVYTLWLSSL